MMSGAGTTGSGTVTKADAFVVNDDGKGGGQQPERHVFHMDALEQQDADNIPFVKGEVQPLEYRDLNYARLFYAQLAAVILTAVLTSPALFERINSKINSATTYTTAHGEDEPPIINGSTLLMILIVSIVVAFFGIASFLTLMMQQTERMVRISFVASPALMLTFGVVLLAVEKPRNQNHNNNYNSGDTLSAGQHFMIYAVVFAVVSALVYRFYQQFIPFAASTLQVAGVAVRSNRGLYVLTAFMPVLLTGWILLWLTALTGVFVVTDDGGKVSGVAVVGSLLLFFSFYFTRSVIQNVFYVTTAGTVGSWWFTPLGDPALCNRDVMDSLHRSLTYSFGSICMGSLIVALVQTLEHMARSARRNRNGALLACLLECILHCIRRWIEYFNSWAFCYVGLYGYDFLTAGRNVITLFQNRGWSSFAADRLVFRVLALANLAVAICAGAAACLVDVMAGPALPPDLNDNGDLTPSRLMAFFTGMIMGLLVSNTALFVMESAVRTVIVCFAESPEEFYEHHPDLCELMRQGWAAAYPDAWQASNYEQVFMAVEAKVVSTSAMDGNNKDEKGTVHVTGTII